MKRSTWLIITDNPLLEVEVFANILFENGDCGYGCNIGESYEIDGSIEYDKSQFSENQINLIDEYLINNIDEITLELVEL